MARCDSNADYKVHEMKSMGKSRDTEAMELLRRISHQVQPIMRRRGWRVPLLTEFFPANPNLLGLNIGGGGGRTREIKVRLRPARDPDSFLPYQSILGTMLHELVHNVRGPHDGGVHGGQRHRRRPSYIIGPLSSMSPSSPSSSLSFWFRFPRISTPPGHRSAFYKLLDEITAECEELMSRGVGGTGVGFDGPSCGRLGSHAFIPQHNPAPGRLRDCALKAAEERAKRQRIMLSGPRRLGHGDGVEGDRGGGAPRRYATPAEAAAAAAERRCRDNRWCPCERLAGVVSRAVAQAEAQAQRAAAQDAARQSTAAGRGADHSATGPPAGSGRISSGGGAGDSSAAAAGPPVCSGAADGPRKARPPPAAAEVEADIIRRIEEGVIDLTLDSDSDSEPGPHADADAEPPDPGVALQQPAPDPQGAGPREQGPPATGNDSSGHSGRGPDLSAAGASAVTRGSLAEGPMGLGKAGVGPGSSYDGIVIRPGKGEGQCVQVPKRARRRPSDGGGGSARLTAGPVGTVQSSLPGRGGGSGAGQAAAGGYGRPSGGGPDGAAGRNGGAAPAGRQRGGSGGGLRLAEEWAQGFEAGVSGASPLRPSFQPPNAAAAAAAAAAIARMQASQQAHAAQPGPQYRQHEKERRGTPRPPAQQQRQQEELRQEQDVQRHCGEGVRPSSRPSRSKIVRGRVDCAAHVIDLTDD